ncbi:MAG: PSD1 and planctomycete cytochrome C domain-containing protein [Armatimonadetes bacterium]|nr:PSD1 and planctomycete cytochrome C domain-containing protein [Armatimonadota bacterium]
MKHSKWSVLALSFSALGVVASLPAVVQTGSQVKHKGAPTKKSATRVQKSPEALVSFNRDIRPILSENCFQCHGPSVKQAKADLRVDNFESATKDRGGYRVITPGYPEKSVLFDRLKPKDLGDIMPPSDTGKHISPEQIKILKTWVKQGAKYEKHWAFIAPVKPTLPAVQQKGWARNDVDRFVLAGLEKRGLHPEAEASKPQLLRRATLTLTGLQPTPNEMRAYLGDKSPKAYENAVDRLLASTRYGENQARFWLDAVRYGDTHGLHLDNERAVYPYRDWVVRELNEDLPYDKFVKWQLAGDLIPNATTSMKIATGYVRMNPTSNEGGAIEAEFLARNTFDRVDTSSTVFLGLTVGCARCHDHKYDPISQADYYKMYAFFNSTKESPFDGNLLTPDPVMRAPLPEEEKDLAARQVRLDKMVAGASEPAALAWLNSKKFDAPVFGKWEFAAPFKAESFDKAFDTEFEVKEWKEAPFKLNEIKVFVNAENAAGYARTTLDVPAAQEIILRVGSDDGLKVWLNGELVHSNKVLRGATQGADEVKLRLKAGSNALIFKVANSGGPDGLVVSVGSTFQKQLDALVAAKGKPSFSKDLRKTYLEFGPEVGDAKKYRAELMAYRKAEEAIPYTLIAEELSKPRPANILRRGEYNLPQGLVTRAVPKALGTLSAGAPVNRLGFAQWLTAPKNPLFSRVFVNRIWQQHFGMGLVKTPEDFGNQGDWPINPELLDYLAVTFQERGYSVKQLHRMLVTSAAFRQSSKLTPEKHLKDPENRLASRGPRFRLDAEVLRDQVLYASGLLVQREGGRGFKPYQPAGLWEEVAFQESTTSKYTPDMTADIYRRTLYLFCDAREINFHGPNQASL